MTKHGHQTFEEFKETWNLTIDDAKIRMYDLTRENWSFRRKFLIANIAICNIGEAITEGKYDTVESLKNDIEKILSNYSEMCKKTRW